MSNDIADILTEKNNHILSLSAKLSASNMQVRDLTSALQAAQDRIIALEQANDRLGTDLFKADALLDRVLAMSKAS